MAVVCAECRAENRDGAKFCRGCGRRLTSIQTAGIADIGKDPWPETQRMPLVPPVVPPVHVSPQPSLRAGAAAPGEKMFVPSTKARRQPPLPPPSPPPLSTRASPFAPIAGHPSKGARSASARRLRAFWISALTFIVVMAALAVAGGWYISRKQAAQTPLPPAAPMAPAAADAPSPPPAQQAEQPPAAEPATPPAAAPMAAEPAPLPQQAAIPAAVPTKPLVAAAKPRRSAPEPASPPVPVAAALAAPEPMTAPAPQPAPPASPQTACAGLGFFARARCMAAECGKPEYAALAQCEPIRRQQQIDEEKRNPSLAN